MILLTGATGFLGKNFVLEFIKSAPIKILTRPSSDVSLFKNNPSIQIIHGYYSDSKSLDYALKDVETVIHCAARTTGRNFGEFYHANVLTTKYLIQAIKRNNIAKLLYISSQAAGGPGSSARIVNEFETERPVSFYGLTKRMAEDVVKASGLQYTILRPCSIYGPYDLEILRFIRLLNNGFYPVIGGGRKYVSLIYVKDVVRLMQKIICLSIFKQKTYYVSDGVCYQFDEVVHEISRILHKSYYLKVRIPKTFAIIFGLLNDIFLPEKKRLIGFDKVREMSQDYWLCKSSEIERDIDWKPEYTFDVGMAQTIKWYRDNGYLES
ncbi:MAG: NAD-dependent epimerase/dehydratase family protein [bacterium]